MTGSELVRQAQQKGWECDAFTRSELDVTARDAVHSAVEISDPDIVFNAAAFTAVDAAESA
ncbi:MAG TPA: sugar nucleotide-binding protein, partial [Gemmatimonadaceae bacterium]|nr:sugar nucleotide-binding protein [Gemmatimonadaceae bacterium]